MSNLSDLELVTLDGENLKYVKNQTREICLAAVRSKGSALRHVRAQTDEICLEAVRQNGLAYVYVWIQTQSIAIAAIQQNVEIFPLMMYKTHKMCLAAVKSNGMYLQYILWGQTPEICATAILQNPAAKKFIRGITFGQCLSQIWLNASSDREREFAIELLPESAQAYIRELMVIFELGTENLPKICMDLAVETIGYIIEDLGDI